MAATIAAWRHGVGETGKDSASRVAAYTRFRLAVRHRGSRPQRTWRAESPLLVATPKRKKSSNVTGNTNGGKNIISTFTAHDGDRIAARHQHNEHSHTITVSLSGSSYAIARST